MSPLLGEGFNGESELALHRVVLLLGLWRFTDQGTSVQIVAHLGPDLHLFFKYTNLLFGGQDRLRGLFDLPSEPSLFHGAILGLGNLVDTHRLELTVANPPNNR